MAATITCIHEARARHQGEPFDEAHRAALDRQADEHARTFERLGLEAVETKRRIEALRQRIAEVQELYRSPRATQSQPANHAPPRSDASPARPRALAFVVGSGGGGATPAIDGRVGAPAQLVHGQDDGTNLVPAQQLAPMFTPLPSTATLPRDFKPTES